MDIFAHTLWAVAGVTVISRRRALSRLTVMATLVLAALPDFLHLLPIAGWWVFADGSFAALHGYAVAVPDQEPV
jgi:hypothetical protein